ncbi:MAG: reprolysin-like metallopeptidase [Candidatus Eiseniibacteriota bacterium]
MLALPLPNGTMVRVRAMESPILNADLRQRLPEVRTYVVTGVDDPRVYGRIDLTALGFRGLIFAGDGPFLIDPWERGKTDLVKSYWAHEELRGSMLCQTSDPQVGAAAPTRRGALSFGAQRRNYRFILMGTGEYTQALGGVSAALAEMVTSVNRVNAIFELELGVHFDVVGLMPFEDPATDPYPLASLHTERNQAVVDSLYGSSSYDVAQLANRSGPPLETTSGGIAVVYGVCDPAYKAYNSVYCGVVTANHEMIRVMAHENGHQLGSWHIGYSGCQFGVPTPYEPGSGSTIMGRAGKCGVFNVQPTADLYFNVANIEQIVTHLDTISCGTVTPTGNSPPSAEAGPDFTIPRDTPFALTGSGSDPDPGDLLTYCWEQQDGSEVLDDLVLGALFRSRLPTTLPTRYFPRFATVLADTLDPWEKLPTVDRLLHFRLTARDGHVGGGGVAWDSMLVTVSGNPFFVTSPNGGESVASGVFPVTWTVGGGAVAAFVNTLLSKDAGGSWTLLAANTPNDGAENVAHYTAITSASCRIRIEAVGNIFYELSNSNFTIVGGTTDVPPDGGVPSILALGVNGPNPATSPALYLDLPQESDVRLGVYSVAGRLVRTLVSARKPAGRHLVTWDGNAGTGDRAAAGVYIVRLAAGAKTLATRLVLAP